MVVFNHSCSLLFFIWQFILQIRVNEHGEEVRHAWYQWVCFVLFLQAAMCYTPHYLWKSWEGGKLNMLMQDLNEQNLDDPSTKKERRMAAVQYFIRTLHSHRLYVAKYVFCEVLNFVNVILQLYLMNFFLGGQVSTFRLTRSLFWNMRYNASQKHESTLLHTYVLKYFLIADRSCTGWSRKIETVKFGCIHSRGRIGFKIYACKIRLIILQ